MFLSQDTMNIILLTCITLTIAPAWGQGGVFSNLASSNNQLEPCQDRSNNNAYDIFARKHIIRETFDRNSKDKWAK